MLRSTEIEGCARCGGKLAIIRAPTGSSIGIRSGTTKVLEHLRDEQEPGRQQGGDAKTNDN